MKELLKTLDGEQLSARLVVREENENTFFVMLAESACEDTTDLHVSTGVVSLQGRCIDYVETWDGCVSYCASVMYLGGDKAEIRRWTENVTRQLRTMLGNEGGAIAGEFLRKYFAFFGI